jgi:flagellar secretion chaperone FliS
MYPGTESTYLEERILTASPLELIQILYDAAADRVRAARLYLKEGDALARSRAVSKAQDILTELTLALNSKEGKDSSATFSAIYGYLKKRLFEAHMHQSDAIFAEVEATLTAMAQNWRGVTNLLCQVSQKTEEDQPQPVEVSRSGIVYAADATANAADGELSRSTRSWNL